MTARMTLTVWWVLQVKITLAVTCLALDLTGYLWGFYGNFICCSGHSSCWDYSSCSCSCLHKCYSDHTGYYWGLDGIGNSIFCSSKSSCWDYSSSSCSCLDSRIIISPCTGCGLQ